MADIDNPIDDSLEEKLRQINELKDPLNTERIKLQKQLIEEEIEKRLKK